MDASGAAGAPSVRRRDLLVAAGLCVLVVGGALALDPVARSALREAPVFHDLFCKKGVVVDVTNQNGGRGLTQPDAGLHVRAHQGDASVPARLVLYVKQGGGPWRFRWQLDAPTGAEIFYIPVVDASTQAYVRAEPKDVQLCGVDSPTMSA